MGHVPELNTIITGMGERMRELEQALATARGHVLDMQRSIDTVLSTPLLIQTEPSFTITQRARALGSFNVNDCGCRLSLLQLSVHLPSEKRAWRLLQTYYRNGCCTGVLIMESETVELLTLQVIYHNISSEDQSQRSQRLREPLCHICSYAETDREKFCSKFPSKLIDVGYSVACYSFVLDHLQGLGVGRPTGTFLSDISCSFPPHEGDDEQPFVRIFQG
ncbi:hypothetical protein C8R47DRAFT_1201981, partial [Mycena vitilis]